MEKTTFHKILEIEADNEVCLCLSCNNTDCDKPYPCESIKENCSTCTNPPQECKEYKE